MNQRLVYESYAKGHQDEHQNKGLLLIAALPGALWHMTHIPIFARENYTGVDEKLLKRNLSTNVELAILIKNIQLPIDF